MWYHNKGDNSTMSKSPPKEEPQPHLHSTQDWHMHATFCLPLRRMTGLPQLNMHPNPKQGKPIHPLSGSHGFRSHSPGSPHLLQMKVFFVGQLSLVPDSPRRGLLLVLLQQLTLWQRWIGARFKGWEKRKECQMRNCSRSETKGLRGQRGGRYAQSRDFTLEKMRTSPMESPCSLCRNALDT